MKLEPLGDSAVVATLGTGIDEATLASVLDFAQALLAARRSGVTDVVPAYATVTVFYEPSHFAEEGSESYDSVCRFMTSCFGRPSKAPFRKETTLVEIPVCYGGDFAPDMDQVAAHAGMDAAALSALHASVDYLVYAIGFTPGFPYLGGLPEALRMPRRDTPRAHVPAGSVAIGGGQTGVYPVDSPGGWNIIGRTPLALFRPAQKQAALLRPGDRVRFIPLSRAEFDSWT
jgi:KipI family sensor histidine kinase inhibitor